MKKNTNGSLKPVTSHPLTNGKASESMATLKKTNGKSSDPNPLAYVYR